MFGDSFNNGKGIHFDHVRILVVNETTGRPEYMGAHIVCAMYVRED